MHVFPDYYPRFQCIAERCKHNCCIGWEIEIDEKSAAFYHSLDGALGAKLREAVSESSTFRLDEGERCPMLTKNGLCQLITELGEDALCDICREHPRFHVALPDRTESGLGLCCEAAGKLILSQKSPMHLIGGRESEDELICLREQVMKKLQDRSLPLEKRAEAICSSLGIRLPRLSAEQWYHILQTLEPLEADREEFIALLLHPVTLPDFSKMISDRAHEYEQLAVYFLYRHFAVAPAMKTALPRLVFALEATRLLYLFGAAFYQKHGRLTPEDQVELCRRFSAEIEYSEENLDTLFSLFDGIDSTSCL